MAISTPPPAQIPFSNNRLFNRFHVVKKLMVRPHVGTILRGREIIFVVQPIDISAGAKGAASAGNDDCAYVIVEIGVPDYLTHLSNHELIESIELLWPVERDQQNLRRRI
jgi:hypothetical protein